LTLTRAEPSHRDVLSTEGELPEGWCVAIVGDVADITSGTYIKRADYSQKSDRLYPVAGAGGPIGWASRFNFAAPVMTLGRVGAAGALNVYESNVWVTDNALVVRPRTIVLFPFLRMFFQTIRWTDLHTGTSQPLITQGIVKRLEIPLPSLAEQERIVAEVAELLARANAARDRLRRVPTILKRFRQAVLAAACSGRLTADWREEHPDVEDGVQLVQKIAAERGSHRPAKISMHQIPVSDDEDALSGVPDSWTWSTLHDITRNFDGRRVPVKEDDRAKRRGQYPYYGASGIIDSIDDYLFDGHFLLLSEDGANLLMRSSPIAFRASGKFWVNNHAHVLQTNGGVPLEYLEACLNGIDLQYHVTGSAQPKLTQANMNRIPVPVPPLEEQREIVRRVEALFGLADAIERRVATATARADRLTQAILAKAFRGELVPTEAELARRDGRTYEPASAVLERIREIRVSGRSQ
jgi:type I restriction enzyme S subunit